jgi:hypothetical protein
MLYVCVKHSMWRKILKNFRLNMAKCIHGKKAEPLLLGANANEQGARRRAPWIVLGPELLASSSTTVGEPGSGPAPAILNLQSVLVFGKWFLEPFCGSGWQWRCRLGSKVLFYLCIQKSISGRSKGLFSWASAGSCPHGGREGNGMWTL